GDIAKADTDCFDQANRHCGETRADKSRRDRMRRSIVRALARVASAACRRTRSARLHHLLRRFAPRNGEELSDEFNRVPSHSRSRRTKAQGFGRTDSDRNQKLSPRESAPKPRPPRRYSARPAAAPAIE